MTPRWWELETLLVRENHYAKILWKVPIPINGDIEAHCPVVILQDLMNRHLYLFYPGGNKIQEAVYVWGTLSRLEETVPRLLYQHNSGGYLWAVHSHKPSGSTASYPTRVIKGVTQYHFLLQV